MKIIRAQHLGFCFGVRDAIELAHQAAALGPLTIVGELVHNPAVIEDLNRRGVSILAESQTPPSGATLMITAHGTSHRRRAELASLGVPVVDATCPLVELAHETLLQLVRQGYYPIVIGRPHHVEVRGLTGDLEEYTVVQDEVDLSQIPLRPGYAVISQTTQPIDRVMKWVEKIRKQFPTSEVRFRDTVCQPTKRRQLAVQELAKEVDVVVVIGGAASNNTRELVSSAGKINQRVHHVSSADDLKAEWFHPEDLVGLTAGTSTPESQIAAVERRLNALCPLSPTLDDSIRPLG